MDTERTGASAEEFDMFIGPLAVTIEINPNNKGWPPAHEQCEHLNKMIYGLAGAARSVIYQAENDKTNDYCGSMEPMTRLVDSILLLSQLSEVIRSSIK